jgi:hypothetical protein
VQRHRVSLCFTVEIGEPNNGKIFTVTKLTPSIDLI